MSNLILFFQSTNQSFPNKIVLGVGKGWGGFWDSIWGRGGDGINK